MGEFEAVGDAVTGGMISQAVEPRAGEPAADGHTHEKACLNCGAALTGPWCHQCGQRAHVHRTLNAFWHDLMHSVFHFEGKIWRTLPMLAWHPGLLTRQYIEGRRATFVSPMALFLFSVFLMFIVFTTLGGPFAIESNAEERITSAQEYRDDRAKVIADIRELEQERRERIAAGQSTTEVDIELRVQREGLALIERVRREEVTRDQAHKPAEARQAASGPKVIAAGNMAQGRKAKLTIGRTGNPSIDAALAKAEANPELLLYKLQNNAYKFSWLLIPLSVPFVWLLFLHRRRYLQFRAYDHTVFVTYSIAFMSLGLVVLTFFRLLGISEALIGLALVFVPPFHIFRQLRGAYALSRWSALWRTVALIVFAMLATSLFLGILVLIGVIG